jgi:hypothetical protein
MNARRQPEPSRQLDMFADLESAESQQRAARAPGLFDLDQIGYDTRLAMAEEWKQVYGHVASIRAAHAWMPCVTQIFSERPATAECRPTILLAELRCEHDRNGCSCVGDLLYRGACFGCTWEGDARTAENPATEDAHDHAWPGWRQLATVPRRPDSGTSAKQQTAIARWSEQVNRLYPQGWLEAGGPIRTTREASGTRHVPDRSGFGGYDLSAGPAATPVARAVRR